ncbi:hypothetical protein psyc5s11_13260 [Clostridium gelidum]|uniref:Uncharacterized protein n=1 Tax=Clostridium gelidum TaxID=704125 RepID=A0ABM7T204_9CLOT|nr:hypothetical protein [Clostridium gelidum]BCZ45259.1 hypothetical protein psyc5s11_13260 [Clostridium gelidum]
MNGQIKKYIYIIGTICIVFLVGKVFLNILPYFILFGLVTYVVMKIIGFIKVKKEKKDSNKFDLKNTADNVDNYKDSTDDYISGEVIDVDYEEVDKNKQ